MRRVSPDTSVPPGESPPARCQYCDRPFRSERARALHVGESHPDDCTGTDAEAYERAREEEEEALFSFHMKVIVAIGVIHAVIVLLYMIAFGSGLL